MVLTTVRKVNGVWRQACVLVAFTEPTQEASVVWNDMEKTRSKRGGKRKPRRKAKAQ